MAALKEYHFEIGPMDDSDQCVAIVGIEYSSVSADEAFYAKEDVVSALAAKDAEIQSLKQKSMDYENRLLHSDYRRSCRILKYCRKKLLEWQNLCTIFHNPEALEVSKAKVALWTKWEARWQKIAERYR